MIYCSEVLLLIRVFSCISCIYVCVWLKNNKSQYKLKSKVFSKVLFKTDKSDVPTYKSFYFQQQPPFDLHWHVLQRLQLHLLQDSLWNWRRCLCNCCCIWSSDDSENSDSKSDENSISEFSGTIICCRGGWLLTFLTVNMVNKTMVVRRIVKLEIVLMMNILLARTKTNLY